VRLRLEEREKRSIKREMKYKEKEKGNINKEMEEKMRKIYRGREKKRNI
jgi:hypothetical protein